jgi:hypothetical protein
MYCCYFAFMETNETGFPAHLNYSPVQKVSDLRPGKKVAYLGGLNS